MAISLFSLKKSPTQKVSSFVDPTKFGGTVSGARKPLRSEVAEKATAIKEVKELSYIRRALETLVTLEKRHYEMVTDSIKEFVLSEQKKQARDEEAQQERRPDRNRKNESKNPIVKQGAKTLEGIGNFFQGLIKTFIAYKFLEWAGNPENVKKIQDFVNLFGNIFKFLNAIVGFGIDKLFSGLSKLVGGEGVTRVFGFLEAVVGFFTLKWLLNPTKIISDIKMIGNLFTKVIPNAINGVINFFSNLIPKAAGEAADEALSQAGRQISAGAGAAAEGAGAATEGAGAAARGAGAAARGAGAATEGAGAAVRGAGAAAKGGAKITGKSLLKALPVIGAVSSAFFAADRASKGDWLGAGGEVLSGVASLVPGWGTAASLGIDAALIGRDIAKDQGLPMLAKGGIVTKPTEAIVGEAGPEAILPLDKLGSFGVNEFKGRVDKQIPSFIKLLTLPFKIVGAGIVALISSSVSKIPGIGPMLMPLISNVASMFGIPPSLVKGMTNFAETAVKSVGQGMSAVKEVFGMEEPKITKSKADEFKPSGDTSVRGLLGDILSALISKNASSNTQSTNTSPAASGNPGATGSPSASGNGNGAAAPVDTAKQSIGKVGGFREDGTLKGVQGTTQVVSNTRGGGTIEEHSPGAGLKPVINGNKKYWYNSHGDVFRWEKPGDPLTDITTNRLFDSKTLGGTLVRIPSSGEVKILKGMFGGDQTAVGMYNYQMNKILKSKGVSGRGTDTKDAWETPQNGKYGEPAKFIIGGGNVHGSGIGDKYPAVLENNEYVLNRNAVAGMGGAKELDKINFGMFPRFGSSKMSQITRNENKASGDGRPRTKFQIGGAAILEGAKKIVGMGKGQGDMCAVTTRAALRAAGHPAAGKVTQKGDLDSEGTKYNGVRYAASFAGSDMGAVVKQASNLQAGDVVLWKGGNGYPAGAITHVGIKGEGNDLWHHGRTAGFRKASMYTSSGGQTFAAGIRLGASGEVGPGADTSTSSSSSGSTSEPTLTSIIPHLADLTKMLTGASATPAPAPAPTQLPAAQVTGSVPARSQQLQAAQKENSNIQAQRRSAGSTGGNVITLPSPNKTITESSTQPMSQTLGGTTPPIPLATYPLAP
jgi:hypothetical protein